MSVNFQGQILHEFTLIVCLKNLNVGGICREKTFTQCKKYTERKIQILKEIVSVIF
jgi:hypothetical protein